jgi:dTDP-4-dehydrorhamnose reductase
MQPLTRGRQGRIRARSGLCNQRRRAGRVARAAACLGMPVVQLSTDYVFDGTSEQPYRESDPTAPINFYGMTKLAGEAAVRAATPNHVILRTSWVYAPFGRISC